MATITSRWIFLPYCIQRLSDDRYIVLNRKYKPLGVRGNDHVVYEEHPAAAKIKITASDARKISHSGSDDLSAIFLYDDATNPSTSKENMHGYSIRLGAFMELPVEES